MNTTSEISPTEQAFLMQIEEGESTARQAGLSGERLATYPDLTLETTEENKNKMIDESILKYCSEQGVDTKKSGFSALFEVMHLMNELVIDCYLDRLKQAEKGLAGIARREEILQSALLLDMHPMRGAVQE